MIKKTTLALLLVSVCLSLVAMAEASEDRELRI